MKLPGPFTDNKSINAIIETPRGSRNKFKYDPVLQLFRLGKVLPAGTAFPIAMGFIPGTEGEDGDPVDVLVIMDAPVYPGCLVECRLLGVIEAEQTEKGKKKPERNDRLIAIPADTHPLAKIRTIKDLDPDLLDEVISFFRYYNRMEGKRFEVIGVKGPGKAKKLVKENLQ